MNTGLMNRKTVAQLRAADSGEVIVPDLELADTPWKRTVGLLGRLELREECGLWIAPCSGVHTLGMRFAIDVVFLDSAGNALRLDQNVRPWSIRGPVRRARVVIELPAGAIARMGIRVGQRYIVSAMDLV